MKKSYLMIIAAAALLMSCSDTDKLTKEFTSTQPSEKIGFSIYSEKATRADQNSTNLYDFYETFDVYSWKTVGTETSLVFSHVPVHYFTTDAADGTVYTGAAKPSDEWGEYGEGKIWQTGWFYKDVRYWDKMASNYTFFAIAPYASTQTPALHVENTSANINIGADNDRYDINTEEQYHMTNEKKYKGFSKDYMLADKSESKFQNVQLVFHHILAKFNVKITLQDEYLGGSQDLTVTKLEVVNLENKGYFEYAGMTTKGWKTKEGEHQYLSFDTDYVIYSKDETKTKYSGYYWFQTLVFPQTLTCMAEGAQTEAPNGKYLYIEYTIGTEVFKAYYDLAYVFDSTLKTATNETAAGTYTFDQGSEYTLNILVGPAPIKFVATAATWNDENKSKELSVQ